MLFWPQIYDLFNWIQIIKLLFPSFSSSLSLALSSLFFTKKKVNHLFFPFSISSSLRWKNYLICSTNNRLAIIVSHGYCPLKEQVGLSLLENIQSFKPIFIVCLQIICYREFLSLRDHLSSEDLMISLNHLPLEGIYSIICY